MNLKSNILRDLFIFSYNEKKNFVFCIVFYFIFPLYDIWFIDYEKERNVNICFEIKYTYKSIRDNFFYCVVFQFSMHRTGLWLVDDYNETGRFLSRVVVVLFYLFSSSWSWLDKHRSELSRITDFYFVHHSMALFCCSCGALNCFPSSDIRASASMVTSSASNFIYWMYSMVNRGGLPWLILGGIVVVSTWRLIVMMIMQMTRKICRHKFSNFRGI